jgi:hypothetical protein
LARLGFSIRGGGRTASGLSLTQMQSIQFLSFATNKITSVVNFEKQVGSLALSPDGRWILFTQIDQDGTELMLVENFH